jgi:hypothetical protein
MITETQVGAAYKRQDQDRAEIARLRAENERLREALIALMTTSGALHGRPETDNPAEAQARATLAGTSDPAADPSADARREAMEEVELWAAEMSSITDPDSGEDFNRGWEEALTETARHCRTLITPAKGGE